MVISAAFNSRDIILEYISRPLSLFRIFSQFHI
jgi:hypothetical protein